MNKKIFTFLLAVAFFLIAAFHFQLNLVKRSQPPSNEWSKEVLISTGNILGNPALLRYKDNYVVIHSDKNKIKIVALDKMAVKLNEKSFSAKGSEPMNTVALTDGTYYYAYWLVSEDGNKSLYGIKLDEKFNLIEEFSEEGQGLYEIVTVGENILALNYGNKITVNNLATGIKYDIPCADAEFLTSAKNKTGYIASFKERKGDIKYFSIKDNTLSEVQTAVELGNISSITYVSAIMTADDNFAYMLMEYRSKGEYGGTKEIKIPLTSKEKATMDEFRIDKSKASISNIVPYYEEGQAKFLASKEVPYDKKRSYDNIVEYNITSKGEFVQVSRTKDLSMFPSGTQDTVVFCDVVDKDKFNVYMASKDKKFIQLHGNQRLSEIKLALIDTISGILFSIVYIIPYGALWVIPIIGIVSIYSVFEYKLTSKNKKIWFMLIYFSFFVFKSLGIRFVSFKRFGYYLPQFMTLGVSLLVSLAISLLCGVFTYIKYSKGVEHNMVATDLFMPIVYDTILTLMVFVPFMV